MPGPLSASLPSSCLSRPVLAALLAGAFVVTAYMPAAAEACGAPQPALNSTVPGEGATYPANAALMFSGHELSLDAVTVTVDGAPAQLVAAPFASGWANISVLVEPAPQVGQQVVVSGTICPLEFCEPLMLTYTAGEPDVTAPVPVPEASFFAVYDHANFESSGGDCESNTDLTLYVHTMQDEAAPGAAPGVVSASWDGGGGGGGFGGFSFASGTSASVRIPITEPQLGGKDPRSEVCVKVTARDAAGNEAEPFELCPACFFREDDTPIQGSFVPEPLWTEADAVPGSACAGADPTTGDSGPEPTTGDSGPEPTSGGTGEPQSSGEVESTGVGETSEQDDGDGKGCACATDGDSRDLGALVLMALGLGLGRRRRR